jgi:Zn-dependent alcohol dehydrogenase
MARAIVFNGTKLELVQKEVSKPTPGHVVVRITIRPLLHVDLFRRHSAFKAIGKPIVPGYEGFGIVHSVRILTHLALLLNVMSICMKVMAMGLT